MIVMYACLYFSDKLLNHNNGALYVSLSPVVYSVAVKLKVNRAKAKIYFHISKTKDKMYFRIIQSGRTKKILSYVHITVR